MPPKKSGRSASRGRAAAKSPAAKKTSTSSKSPAPPTPKSPKTPKKSAKKATPAKKSAKKTSPKKKAATPVVHKMEFDEGDNIMARWPGTSLFFKVSDLACDPKVFITLNMVARNFYRFISAKDRGRGLKY